MLKKVSVLKFLIHFRNISQNQDPLGLHILSLYEETVRRVVKKLKKKLAEQSM